MSDHLTYRARRALRWLHRLLTAWEIRRSRGTRSTYRGWMYE
jgi:hypothetical protein